jgi:hypothetical protein
MIPANWQRFAERTPEGRIVLALTSPTRREPWEPPSWIAQPDVKRSRFFAFSHSPPRAHPEDGTAIHSWLATHPGAHVLYPLIKQIQPRYIDHIYPRSDDAKLIAERGVSQADVDAQRAELSAEDRGEAVRYLVNLLRALIDKDGDALDSASLKGTGMKWTAKLIERLTGAPVAATAATLDADPRLAVRRARDAEIRAADERRKADAKADEAWRRFIYDIDGRQVTGTEARDVLAQRAKLVVQTKAPKASRILFYTERDRDTGKWRILAYSLENSQAASFDTALPASVPVVKGTRQVYTTTKAAEEFDFYPYEVGRFSRATRAVDSGGKPIEPDILAGTPAILMQTNLSLSKRAESIVARDGWLPSTWYYAQFILLDPKTAPARLDPFAAERAENDAIDAADEGYTPEEAAEAAALFKLGNFDFKRPPADAPPPVAAAAPTFAPTRKLASGPTFEDIKRSVAAFYGGETKALHEVIPNLWRVVKADGSTIRSVAVRSPKPGHYYFEQGVWSNLP